jgi:hypothetical protein
MSRCWNPCQGRKVIGSNGTTGPSPRAVSSTQIQPLIGRRAGLVRAGLADVAAVTARWSRPDVRLVSVFRLARLGATRLMQAPATDLAEDVEEAAPYLDCAPSAGTARSIPSGSAYPVAGTSGSIGYWFRGSR